MTTRREFNKAIIDRKKKVTIIKGSLGLAAFLVITIIVGHSDMNTYKGIHSTKGIVTNSGTVHTESGDIYKIAGFKPGVEVTMKLDGQGNILSIVTK